MKRYMQSSLYCLILGFAALVFAQPPAKTPRLTRATASQAYYQAQTLDINRIAISFNNQGYLDYRNQGSGGAFWPNKNSVIVFDQGFWVIGKMNQELRLALGMWGSSYSPGPMIGGKPVMQARPGDSLRYRAYKISRGDTPLANSDCAEWPADLGAPVVAPGKIKLLGDQMIWMAYNGADSTVSYWWEKDPLVPMPVEIQQKAFAHAIPPADSSHILANTVFLEWKIINKGNVPIDSAYASLWTDIDFGSSLNPPAVDTANQVGYCWEGSDRPTGDFGIRVPAIGYVWLYGPSVPSPGNTAVFLGRQKPDFKNLPMSSFWGIIDDGCYENYPLLGHACSIQEAWNIARGLDKSGNQIIDPTTGRATKFPYSGDPVTGSGWLHSPNTGGGAGFNIFSGPFNLAPNDTQWVMVALVPAQGADRLDSIRQLRRYANILRSALYEELTRPSLIECHEPIIIPERYALLQSYPNPAQANVLIEFQIPRTGPVELKVFDILGREIATLFDGEATPKKYSVVLNTSNLSAGVYFYRLQAGGFTQTKKLLLLR